MRSIESISRLHVPDGTSYNTSIIVLASMPTTCRSTSRILRAMRCEHARGLARVLRACSARAAGRRQAPSSRVQIFGIFSDFLIDFLRDNPIHVPTHTHVPYNTPGPPQGGVIQYPYPSVPIPQHLHISAKIPNTRAYPG